MALGSGEAVTFKTTHNWIRTIALLSSNEMARLTSYRRTPSLKIEGQKVSWARAHFLLEGGRIPRGRHREGICLAELKDTKEAMVLHRPPWNEKCCRCMLFLEEARGELRDK